MAEKEINCDDDPEPTLKPEIGRDLCRMKIFRDGDYGEDMQSGDYGGYRKDILTENITEREKAILICRKCKGIMKEACISERGEQLCSCCCEKSITKGPHTAIREMVDSLKCSCPLIERGCKWLGILESCENHLDTCGYVYETCKQNCGIVLRREEFERHEKENCSQRVVKCDHCDGNFISCELDGHLKKCPKMKVSCDLVGCGTKITREDMELHLMHNCGMVQEMCKLGCGVELTRNELRIHEKGNCPQRFVKCNHCDEKMKFCEFNGHLNECPKKKVLCNLCGTKITRDKMELHLRHDCGMVQETCKLGCGEELTRVELVFHEKEKCPQRFVKCDHCNNNFKSCQLNIHHNVCPKMKVSCDLCDTKMTRDKMELHLKHDCGMVQETCKLGCGAELTRNELVIHEKEKCPQRLVKCDHCDEKIKFCELNGHLDECPKMKVSCDLCDTKMTREEMELHLRHDCGMVKEACKLGCGEELTRVELVFHEKEKCPQRFVKCDHCNNNFKSCQLNIHHNVCPKMKVSCDLCDTKMTRDKMELHLKHDCGMVQETCKLGCGAELTRNELVIHEKEKCPQRLVKCDHCDEKIKSYQLSGHYDECPKMNLSCNLCDTKITREEMELHLKYDCGMVKETCKLGCGMELTRVELVIHEKEKCRRRLVKCDHCDEKIKSYQLSGHYDECPKMNLSCNLCDTKITREEMELHLKHDCGMVQEMCKLGCGVELTRVELVIHEKENCVQRKVQCEHCYIEVAFCDNSKHLKECPEMKVLCDLCSVEKCRKDMTQHLEDDCPEKMLDCPFVKYKCLARMKRKDIAKHLEEKETKHLGLKLTAMEDLITKQSEIIDKLNENIEKQNKETTTKFSQQIKFLYFITDTTKIVWKIEDVRYPINYSSISKQYKVAGYKIAFKFHYCGSLSIVFPGTTINNVRPFIAKCHIILHTRDTINCGIIEVKQKDVTKGYERIITSISYEDINKYSEHEFPGATKKDLTLEIFITMQ